MGGKTVDNVEELDILTYDGLRMRVGATSDDQLGSDRTRRRTARGDLCQAEGSRRPLRRRDPQAVSEHPAARLRLQSRRPAAREGLSCRPLAGRLGEHLRADLAATLRLAALPAEARAAACSAIPTSPSAADDVRADPRVRPRRAGRLHDGMSSQHGAQGQADAGQAASCRTATPGCWSSSAARSRRKQTTRPRRLSPRSRRARHAARATCA